MCRLLKEAMDAGACGWSAQRTAPGSGYDVQRDHDGTPFATDLMSNETALALGRGAGRLRPRLHPDADRPAGRPDGQEPGGGGQRQERVRKHLEDLARISDSAIILNAITTDSRHAGQPPPGAGLDDRTPRTGVSRSTPSASPAAAASPSPSPTAGTCTTTPTPGATPPWATTEERIAKLSDPARRAGAQDRPAQGAARRERRRPQAVHREVHAGQELPARRRRPGDGLRRPDRPAARHGGRRRAARRCCRRRPSTTTRRSSPTWSRRRSRCGACPTAAPTRSSSPPAAFTTDSIIKWVREQEIVTPGGGPLPPVDAARPLRRVQGPGQARSRARRPTSSSTTTRT